MRRLAARIQAVRPRPAIAILLAAGALGVAVGCGGDDDSSTSATSAATSAASTAAATTAEPASTAPAETDSSQSVTDYAKYVGGSGKADASKSPVYIGWVNQEGGQETIGAAATDGADLAVQAINDKYGGIQGHPLKLKKCFIKSAEEEGTSCAQKLGNDPDVPLVVMGGVAIGIQSFYSSMDKPVITGVAVTPVDGAQKNATVLFGDATHVLGPFGTYARDVLHAKTAALVYPNISGITDGAAALQKGLQDAGIKVKRVGYAQGQTDLIGPLTAAGAQSADIVIPYSDASGCVNQAKALKQLGINDNKKIVSAPLCLNPTVSEGLGGDYPIWTYAIASSLFGDPTDPGMKPYMALTEEYKVKTAPDPWVIVSFGTMLTAAKILNQVGPDASTAEIVDAAHSFQGPVALGAPSLQCGKDPKAPAICNDQTQFFTYNGKNDFKKAAPWSQPPS
jgi:branched-chain amino acid transport system substrate-binding protein